MVNFFFLSGAEGVKIVASTGDGLSTHGVVLVFSAGGLGPTILSYSGVLLRKTKQENEGSFLTYSGVIRGLPV